jgi:WD40 repeat protein
MNENDLIETLRNQAEARCQSYDSSVFIPLLGKRFESSEDLLELEDLIADFLADDCPLSVCVLYGDGGAGKSTFLMHLTMKLWKEYDTQKPIPVFISLPLLNDPFSSAVEDTLAFYRFTQKEISFLKSSKSFIFVLDGYDELHQLRNLYVLNRLDEWNAKVLISCRTQHFYNKDNSRLYFAPFGSDGPKFQLLREVYVAPFCLQNIKDYLSILRKSSVEVPLYSDLMKIPGLQEIIVTPLLLKFAVEALPTILADLDKSSTDQQFLVVRHMLYKSFVCRWFEREETSRKATLLALGITDFKSALWHHCESISLIMHRNNISWLSSSDNRFADFFANTSPAELLRSACPLNVKNGKLGFWHSTLADYFLSENVYLKSLETSSVQVEADISEDSINFPPLGPLYDRRFTDDLAKLCFLSDRFRDSRCRDWLLDIIRAKGKSENYSIGAANAISILNVTRHGFSELNLEGICVPYANLDSAVFDGTNLKGADLSNALLRNAWLNNANLENAVLTDVQFRQQPRISVRHDVTSCCYSPGGDLILVASEYLLTLYDSSTLEKLKRFNGHTATINDVAFNSSATHFVSGSGFEVGGEVDNTIRVWEISGGQEINRMIHSSAVECVCISSTNLLIGFGDSEGNIRVYNLESDDILVFAGHSKCVKGVLFSVNNETLISGGWDGSIRIWNIDSQKQMRVIESPSVYTLALSANNRFLASGGRRSHNVSVWNVETGSLWLELKGHHDYITSVTFSPNDQYVASSSKDGFVKLWDLSSGKLLNIFLSDRSLGATSVSFHPSGQYIVSGYGTCTREERTDIEVRIWEVKGEDSTFLGKSGKVGFVNCVAFSPDGSFFAVAIDGGFGSMGKGYLEIRASSNGELYYELVGHPGNIHCVAWSSDNRWIASGGIQVVYDSGEITVKNVDADVRLWNAISGDLIKRLGNEYYRHSAEITDLAFSPDNQLLASASADNAVLLHHVESGLVFRVFYDFALTKVRLEMNQPVGVNCIRYRSDGEVLVSGGADGVIKIWDVYHQKERIRLLGHSGNIVSLHLSEDKNLLLSSSYDNSVRLWNTVNGESLQVLLLYKLTPKIFADTPLASFAPDGKNMVICVHDKSTLEVRDMLTHEIKFSVSLGSRISSLTWFGPCLLVGQAEATCSFWRYDGVQLILKWTNLTKGLSAENCNFSDCIIEEKNMQIIQQQGASRSRTTMNLEHLIFSMSRERIICTVLAHSSDRAIPCDEFYHCLVKIAVKLRLHLAQDQVGNTALHLVIKSNQLEKILCLLRNIEEKDVNETSALFIGNAKLENPLQLLMLTQKNSPEICFLVREILTRIAYHNREQQNDREQFQRRLHPPATMKLEKSGFGDARTHTIQPGNKELIQSGGLTDNDDVVSKLVESEGENSVLSIHSSSVEQDLTVGGDNTKLMLPARSQLDELLASQLASYGADHPCVAVTLKELGDVCLKNEDSSAAFSFYRQSKDMLVRLHFRNDNAFLIELDNEIANSQQGSLTQLCCCLCCCPCCCVLAMILRCLRCFGGTNSAVTEHTETTIVSPLLPPEDRND